jgi:hypothetical protein
MALKFVGLFFVAFLWVAGPPAALADAPSSHADTGLNARVREAAREADAESESTESKRRKLDRLLGPNLPKMALRTEFVVETNRRGQVARVRSGKNSKDRTFDLMTYGNVLQTFIRTTSGRADAGTFRVTYNYSPATHVVKRNVSLISLGGVNPNAEGAVSALHHEQATHAHRAHK